MIIVGRFGADAGRALFREALSFLVSRNYCLSRIINHVTCYRTNHQQLEFPFYIILLAHYQNRVPPSFQRYCSISRIVRSLHKLGQLNYWLG